MSLTSYFFITSSFSFNLSSYAKNNGARYFVFIWKKGKNQIKKTISYKFNLLNGIIIQTIIVAHEELVEKSRYCKLCWMQNSIIETLMLRYIIHYHISISLSIFTDIMQKTVFYQPGRNRAFRGKSTKRFWFL